MAVGPAKYLITLFHKGSLRAGSEMVLFLKLVLLVSASGKGVSEDLSSLKENSVAHTLHTILNNIIDCFLS